MALYGGKTHPEQITAGLGRTWKVMEISQKAYSGCRYSHASLDAILGLQKEHGFTPQDVRKVTSRILSTGAALVNDPTPWQGNKGLQGTRFSAQFNIAIAVLYGRSGLWNLLDNSVPLEYRDRSEVREMMQRIEVIPDDELDKNFPDKWSTVLSIELRNGRTLTRAVDWPSGEPETPLGEAILTEKFNRLTAMAGWTPAHARELIPEVMTLDKAINLDRLLQFL
jgi:2-methylcitrate dehydratase PrpD